MVLERADEPIENGTPINKALFDSILEDILSHTHYVAGTYTGDGTEGRVIALDFKPKAVIVFHTKLSSSIYRQIGLATQRSKPKF